MRIRSRRTLSRRRVFQSSTAALELGGAFLEQLKNEVDVPWSGVRIKSPIGQRDLKAFIIGQP